MLAENIHLTREILKPEASPQNGLPMALWVQLNRQATNVYSIMRMCYTLYAKELQKNL